MNACVIRTENLTRDFGVQRALDGLDLEIGGGRVVALLGPNGAGKSTLLRLLTGLIAPTQGQSWVLGAPSRALPGEVFGRVATILDGCEPPRWATPAQMIALQADASPGFDRETAIRLVTRLLGSISVRYGTLSKGQKRWVLAALCLATGGDLLLLDEPADGLDTAARREVYDRIRDYVNEHEATALITTHIIHDIERIADDVAILNRGRLIMYESLEDLRDRIREVDLPAQASTHFAPDVTVLETRREGERLLCWVDLHDADEGVLRAIHGTEVRRVDLEQLYLALTRPEADEAVATTKGAA